MDFTGHNPSDYLRLRRRFDVENPNHSLDVGPLPIEWVFTGHLCYSLAR